MKASHLSIARVIDKQHSREKAILKVRGKHLGYDSGLNGPDHTDKRMFHTVYFILEFPLESGFSTIYSNTYDLRPFSVLLTVKFSLR